MKKYFQRTFQPSSSQEQPYKRKPSSWFVGAGAIILLGMLPASTGYLSKDIAPQVHEPVQQRESVQGLDSMLAYNYSQPYRVMGLTDPIFIETNLLEKYME